MGLDQPDVGRERGKIEKTRDFLSSDGTAEMVNELLRKGMRLPLFLPVLSVCKFTIYINSCLVTRKYALSHIERRWRQ